MAIRLTLDPEPGVGVDLFDQVRHMTDDEFFFFCQENPDYHFERDADGTIKAMAQTGGETGRKNAKLTSRLDIWSDDTQLGVVFDSSTGFRLPNGATRGPDAAWVSNARWQALTPEQRKRFPPLCPDFIAELLSESDTIDATETKLREYIANGCQLGWLIDPRTEEIRIYRADSSVTVLHGFGQSLTGEGVLPGFVFDLGLLR
jgi:Uma2 family endonuclease